MHIEVYIDMVVGGLLFLQPALVALLLALYHWGWLAASTLQEQSDSRQVWKRAAFTAVGALVFMAVLWVILPPVVLCCIVLAVPMNVGLLVGLWRRKHCFRDASTSQQHQGN